MAWIESHDTLARHPKTRRLCRVLNISTPQAIGHLHLLWWWALEYAEDGELTGFDPLDIAEAVMWEGEPGAFYDALVAVGYIDADCRLHDWHDYAGRLIEQRRVNAERQRAWQAKRKSTPPPAPPPVSNGHITTGDISPNSYVTVSSPLANTTTVQDSTEPNQTVPNESTDPARTHEAQQREAFDRELAAPDPPGTPVNRQRKAPRPVPEIPLPKSYPLTEEMRVWLAQEIPELRDPDTEHNQFCRHWHSKQNETRTDWRPMWEKWMTDAVTRFAPRGASTGDVTRERSRYESPAERKEREWLESFSYRTRDPDSGWDSGQPPALPGGTSHGEVIEFDRRRVG